MKAMLTLLMIVLLNMELLGIAEEEQQQQLRASGPLILRELPKRVVHYQNGLPDFEDEFAEEFRYHTDLYSRPVDWSPEEQGRVLHTTMEMIMNSISASEEQLARTTGMRVRNYLERRRFHDTRIELGLAEMVMKCIAILQRDHFSRYFLKRRNIKRSAPLLNTSNCSGEVAIVGSFIHRKRRSLSDTPQPDFFEDSTVGKIEMVTENSHVLLILLLVLMVIIGVAALYNYWYEKTKQRRPSFKDSASAALLDVQTEQGREMIEPAPLQPAPSQPLKKIPFEIDRKYSYMCAEICDLEGRVINQTKLIEDLQGKYGDLERKLQRLRSRRRKVKEQMDETLPMSPSECPDLRSAELTQVLVELQKEMDQTSRRMASIEADMTLHDLIYAQTKARLDKGREQRAQYESLREQEKQRWAQLIIAREMKP